MLLQVQQLITLAKRLQQSLAASDSSSSPCQQHQQHPPTLLQCTQSTSAHQVLSDIFRALAVLGEVLTPSPSLLLDDEAEDDSPNCSLATAAAVHTHSSAGMGALLKSPAAAAWRHSDRSAAAAASPGGLATAGVAGTMQHALSASGRPYTSSCGDTLQLQLRAQLKQQQACLQELLTDKAALQQCCDDQQWQLQQQQQAGGSAGGSRLEDVRHLAEVAALQGQKQQLQQEVSWSQEWPGCVEFAPGCTVC
jgi:hypothetical protein